MAGNDVTVTTMQNRALDLADLTGSSFPVADRLIDYANEGLTNLYDVLVDSFQDYVRAIQTVTLIGGTESYALDTSFYKMLKVFYEDGNYRWKVEHYSLDECDGLRTSPVSSGSLKIWYAPMCPLFTLVTDKVSDKVPALPVGWEKYIVYHMGVCLLTRARIDTRQMLSLREAEVQRIKNMAQPRDVGSHECVSDYYDRWGSERVMMAPKDRHFRYHLAGMNILVSEVEWKGVVY